MLILILVSNIVTSSATVLSHMSHIMCVVISQLATGLEDDPVTLVLSNTEPRYIAVVHINAMLVYY